MEGISDAVIRLFDVQKQVGTLAGLTSRVYNLLHLLREPEVVRFILPPTSFNMISVRVKELIRGWVGLET